jgi:hypothetical protein
VSNDNNRPNLDELEANLNKGDNNIGITTGGELVYLPNARPTNVEGPEELRGALPGEEPEPVSEHGAPPIPLLSPREGEAAPNIEPEALLVPDSLYVIQLTTEGLQGACEILRKAAYNHRRTGVPAARLLAHHLDELANQLASKSFRVARRLPSGEFEPVDPGEDPPQG